MRSSFFNSMLNFATNNQNSVTSIGVSVSTSFGTHGMTLYNNLNRGLILNDIGSRGVNHRKAVWEKKWINETTLTHWYYLKRLQNRR